MKQLQLFDTKNLLVTVHLTLTGMAAGYPLCGIDKQKALDNGHKFSHAQHVNVVAANQTLCPTCQKIWETA
jgi:hypothetical protein